VINPDHVATVVGREMIMSAPEIVKILKVEVVQMSREGEEGVAAEAETIE